MRLMPARIRRKFFEAMLHWSNAESHPECEACLAAMRILQDLRDPAGAIALVAQREGIQ